MQKMLGALVMSLAVLAAAPSVAKAHDRHHRGSDFGFGFNFGDGGSFWFGSGCAQPTPTFPSGRATCGHWEYRTESYLIQAGYWNRVFVSDGCGCGRWETVWVAPVYGSRTVRVWVNY